VGILEPPLLLASALGKKVGILTTSPGWVPLLEHDIYAAHLTALCSAGVVTSGMAVLDLEHLPAEEVRARLGKVAQTELVGQRGAEVIVLGCAGMTGLEAAVRDHCGGNVRVIDPVKAALVVVEGLLKLGVGA
jgi:Asp/Glu/hydantoin racemase